MAYLTSSSPNGSLWYDGRPFPTFPMPDWMELAKTYRGKWVAMKPDHKTVAGSGDSFDAALADAKKKGCEEPFLAHIPKTPRYFAGGIR